MAILRNSLFFTYRNVDTGYWQSNIQKEADDLGFVKSIHFDLATKQYYTNSVLLDTICVCYSLSHFQLFVTQWTVQPPRFFCSWDFPGKDTCVGCHFLLQGIFPTQKSNPCLQHCSRMLYHLSY